MKAVSSMESTDAEKGADSRPGRYAGSGPLFWSGIVIAMAAVVSYFGFTLNQPGSAGFTWIHEVLAVVGTSAAFVGLWRNRGRWFTWIGAGFVAVLACLLLAYVHLISSQLPSVEGVINVGFQAPDFSLLGPDGKGVDLQDYRGRPLVLIFYRGYW